MEQDFLFAGRYVPVARRYILNGRCEPQRCSQLGQCAVQVFDTRVFENLEDFPKDWKMNPAAFVKFVREHQCPSFLEYGEYPYASGDEIKKALRVKAGDARSDAISRPRRRR